MIGLKTKTSIIGIFFIEIDSPDQAILRYLKDSSFLVMDEGYLNPSKKRKKSIIS